MNLMSCDNCGVVLDVDKLGFPPEYDLYVDTASGVDKTKAVWSKEQCKFIPAINCPVCATLIGEPKKKEG